MGSILDGFLNIGFIFAILRGSGKILDFMERLYISVTGFARIFAPISQEDYQYLLPWKWKYFLIGSE